MACLTQIKTGKPNILFSSPRKCHFFNTHHTKVGYITGLDMFYRVSIISHGWLLYIYKLVPDSFLSFSIYYVLEYVFLPVSSGSNSTQYSLYQWFVSFSANPFFSMEQLLFLICNRMGKTSVLELYLTKNK